MDPCRKSLRTVDTREIGASAADRPYSVCVLRSTYNGENYIADQIRSIASQVGVNVVLQIRDDGSSDSTIGIANDVCSSEGLKHSITAGRNVGFLNSFESLLLMADSAEYYAFSDQDDVWDNEKLIKAIDCLSEVDGKPALYASSVTITDENLKTISRNDFTSLVYSIPAELIRHRLAGHTMVWNEALQKKIRDVGGLSVWSHDQHVVLLGAVYDAPLYIDRASYVRHRRLRTSVTPGGSSLNKRIRHELALTLNKGGKINRRLLAKELLNIKDATISLEDKHFLEQIASLDNSLTGRIELVRSPLLHCGLLFGDIEARLSVLLDTF